MCVKLRDEIQRRGGKAWIIQEEDGDRDPTNSIGRDLNNVARLCVDLAKTVGGVDAYLSMHYGAEPVNGFFVVYPDGRDGGGDSAADNPLDLKLARAIVARVRKTDMGIRGTDGLLSERKSNVGIQGYRLGELASTVGFRDTTVRLILEGGNSNSPAELTLLWLDKWQNEYVSAIADGLEDTFGIFKGGTAPLPEPAPEPTPKPTYESPSPIRELAGERPLVLLNNGATLVRVDAVVETISETPRLKYAGGTAIVGPPIPKGERFLTDYLVILENGDKYWYTPWATRIRYDDTKIIEPEGR